ncbi:MAG: undecaprenyl/decaprenyl-phosphate alpha-N-acetylglucosaminyl 1-phosphate transferase [Actinomycetaceae bacterium]|nr:undecaprenyl/decaprenyl-phosphate alpha-N-acetylglucosaminyl 1-phosphate transferase [Actinomycetaceae bacterium]
MRVYLLMLVIAAACTYLLVPLTIYISRRFGALTPIRTRDVHDTPIPRLGGVAMYIGILCAYVCAMHIPYLSRVLAPGSAAWGVLWGSGVMCLVGLIDDIAQLVWYAKLAGEILAAGVMAWQGVTFETIPFMGLTVGSSRMNLFVTVFVVLIVVNAVNFIDGLDGLAAGVIGIASGTFFLYAYWLTRNATPGDYSSLACATTAPLIGACIGFLPYNFYKAKTFMGDSGSLMLGAVIAGACIEVTGQIDPANTHIGYALPAWMPLLAPFVILLIPLGDLIFAVVRRLIKGSSPFVADGMHVHHRLIYMGYSHRGSVIVLYMWAAIFSFSWISLAVFSAKTVAPFALLAMVIGGLITYVVMKVSKYYDKAQKRANFRIQARRRLEQHKELAVHDD